MILILLVLAFVLFVIAAIRPIEGRIPKINLIALGLAAYVLAQLWPIIGSR